MADPQEKSLREEIGSMALDVESYIQEELGMDTGLPTAPPVETNTGTDIDIESYIQEELDNPVTMSADATPTEQLPEIGRFPIAGDPPEMHGVELMDQFKIAMGLLTTADPEDAKLILEANAPGVTFREDEEGNYIAKMPDGFEYVINSPGASVQDLNKFIFDFAAFFGPGKIQSLIKGVGADVGVDLMQQGANKALGGGDISAEEAVTTGLFSGFLRKISDFVGNTGRDVVEDAADVVETARGEGVDILTTDINPPQTRFGKQRQVVRESIPDLVGGTGGARAEQGRQQAAYIDKIRSQMGVDSVPGDDFEKAIIDSLLDMNSAQMTTARNMRNQAINAVDGATPMNFPEVMKTTGDLIQQQSALRKTGDKALTTKIQNYVDSLIPDRGFTNLQEAIAFRTRIINEIKRFEQQAKGPAPGEAAGRAQALRRLKGAMDRDIKAHIKQYGGDEALDNWNRSNKIFDVELTKSKQSELRRLINQGEITPEIVMPILRQGKKSQIGRLSASLTDRGRNAVRGAVVRDLFDKATDRGVIDPTRFSKAVDDMPDSVKDTFFTGPQRAMFDGITRVVKLTEEAVKRQTSGGEITGVSQATSFVPNLARKITGSLGSLLTLGGSTILYESRPIRNTLIAISKMRSNDKIVEALQTLDHQLRTAAMAARQGNEE